MTIQEICTFERYKLKPVFFVVNNEGYLVERVISKDPEYEYNNLHNLRYGMSKINLEIP